MPFSAPAMRVNGTLVLQRVDQRQGVAVFRREATLDSESARASVQAMADDVINRVMAPMQPMLDAQGADAESMSAMVEMMLPQFNLAMSETTTGEVDLTTGMARRTVTDYVVTMSGPESEGAAQPVTMRLNYVMTVTPGAAPVPTLPR
jgi:hypothetical protein